MTMTDAPPQPPERVVHVSLRGPVVLEGRPVASGCTRGSVEIAAEQYSRQYRRGGGGAEIMKGGRTCR
jgi:hypothetical protein